MLITSIQNHQGNVYLSTVAYNGGMEDSIFTKIIKGEIPSHKVYEDEKTLAFLDINPANEGHTLVISKNQVEFVWDLGSEDYEALTQTVKKVAVRLKEVYPDHFIAELVIGVDVPHAHVHLIPFLQTAEIQGAFSVPRQEPDHVLLASVAEKLRFE